MLWYRQLLNQYFAKPIQPKHMIAQMLGADMLGFKKFSKFIIILTYGRSQDFA